MVDSMILSVIPVLLEEGIPLFHAIGKELPWGVPFLTFGIVFILNAILQKLFL
jgi:hypothetical protein